MIKKGLLISAAAVLLFAASGCGRSAAYQVIMEQTEDGNRKISYPQLSGWELEDKQLQWNMYFKEQAEALTEGLTEHDYVEAVYEITEQEEGILSLINRQYFEYETAAHPSAALDAVTIDMYTGERLTLKDLAEPSEVTEALINEKDYQIIEGVVELTLPDILEQNWIENGGSDTAELLTASFAHFDEKYENYGEGELIGKSYIKDGKLCLIFSVQHAVGDYVVIQLDDMDLK